LVVHCNAGKGRTGTVICCFLLFSGLFETPEDAMKYYSKKRFNIGDAVTQPGQKRYINYFYRLLRENHFFPLRKTLKSIRIKHIPLKNKKGEIKPYIEVYFENSDNLAYTNKTSYFDQEALSYDENSEVTITEKDFALNVIGDATVKMYTQELLTIKKLGRISFNTAFLSPGEESLVFSLSEIDPDSMMKKTYINKDFKITLELLSNCKCQNTSFPINICEICSLMLKDDLVIWQRIHGIIEANYKPNKENSEKILFGKEKSDMVEVLESLVNEQKEEVLFKNSKALNDNDEYEEEEDEIEREISEEEGEERINRESFDKECTLS